MDKERRASASNRVASRDGVGSASRTPYGATARGQARLCRRPSLHAHLHERRQHAADAHGDLRAPVDVAPECDHAQCRIFSRRSGRIPKLRRGGEGGGPVRRPSLSLWRRLRDRKSTRLNSSHTVISYAVFCLKKKKKKKKNKKQRLT